MINVDRLVERTNQWVEAVLDEAEPDAPEDGWTSVLLRGEGDILWVEADGRVIGTTTKLSLGTERPPDKNAN